MKIGLKYKILIPTIIIFIMCIGLIGTVSYITSKNAMEALIFDELMQISESTINNIDKWVAGRKLDVIGWSKQRLFRTAVQSSYLGKNARHSANMILTELIESYQFYYNICVADINGDIVSSSASEIPGQFNISEMVFFKNAMEGKISISEIMKCFLTDNFTFRIAAPIFADEKQIAGVLFGSISLEYLAQEFISPIKIAQTGYVFMFQNNGTIIFHPDKSLVLNNNLKELAFGKHFLEKKEGIVRYRDQGGAKFAGLAPSILLDWTLGGCVDRKEILKPVDRQSHFILAISFGSIVVIICFLVFIASFVTKPIQEIVKRLKDIAEGKGNLSIRIDIANKDEIGELAEWFNLFVENLRAMILDIATATEILKKSSGELAMLSSEIASSSKLMESQAQAVTGFSEQVISDVSLVSSSITEANSSVHQVTGMADEISSTFNKIADFARKTSDSVRQIAESNKDVSSGISKLASSTEDMTSSLNEVAKHTSQASKISQNAQTRTDEINSKMDALVAASKEIGKVIGVIKDIADQTNMLALNATIEAAGAGESGRGFAVVAGEVKELAKQSADATDIISDNIEQIQKSIDDTVTAVGEISEIINQLVDINKNIAISAEEQTGTANEIAMSISNNAEVIVKISENATKSSEFAEEIASSTAETSKTAKDVAAHMMDLAKMMTDNLELSVQSTNRVKKILENINELNSDSSKIAVGSAQIQESSKELAHSSESLSKIVRQFTL